MKKESKRTLAIVGAAVLGVVVFRCASGGGSDQAHPIVAGVNQVADPEIVEPTLPLELGEGDAPGPFVLLPGEGQELVELSAGTRVEQLKPRGFASPPSMVAARRVRVLAGPKAGVIGWVSGTQVQAARAR